MLSINRYITLLWLVFVFVGCQKKEGSLFKNPTSDITGITFQNDLTETDDLNILDYLYFYNGGGLAVGDINNDGLPDIYFSGNQVKNQLYVNKGNLQFENISEQAGVEGKSTWNTGAVMGDVNGDGFLDIYVCAVVGINGFNGYNELFINNGDNTFTERAASYGLDFDSYSSSAAFLDYDLDGDLDIYLLNHAVHTQESFGRADLRLKRNYQTGDKLLRNDGKKFTDVSEEAGIYGGVNGYGLGIAIADFNQDGAPDIYVGNDFHEDDYYYINNNDGTFTEGLKKYFGHTTRFSMGNDVADLNHDGRPDILSLDMLAKDEKVIKSSEGDDNIQTLKMRTQQFGYHYQYTRNMLQINQADGTYSEMALQSGIAATDWSWSGLFADFDQDGEQDLFVSNGIPKRPNDLDFINFVSDEQIKKKINNTKLVDQRALDMMPSGATHNFVFKGNADIKFQDKSGIWTRKDTLVTGATALADFDLDGDLDLITNNINSPATLYINKTNEKANYIKIKFETPTPNTLGIGTKVFSYYKGQLQYKELYTVRGFQASSEPLIHFGYGNGSVIDSLRIVWPDKSTQLLKNVPVNQTLILRPEDTNLFDLTSLFPKKSKLFSKIDNALGVDFKHTEDNYIDFNRQKLIPYQISDRGPATAVGDLNNDGKADIFFGGSKFKPSSLYIQGDSTFVSKRIPSIINDSIKEEVVALIADLNNDQRNDLLVGSGGADFYSKRAPLLDSYYLQNDSTFTSADWPDYYENASVIKAYDFDADGDLDIFVGAQSVSNDYGSLPNSFLLKNEGDKFTLIENKALQNIGMVTDAIWDDFDNDGIKDLIVVGEWMQPTFFKNEQGNLTKIDPVKEEIMGLWQRIIPFDIDHDGDTDYVLGNWGLNSKFKASKKYPMKMYYADFDENRQTETIVFTEKGGKYYPIMSFNELASQLVDLRKKFTSYKDFAGKTIEEILDKKRLQDAQVFEVNTLASGYLKNENGSFQFVAFQAPLQVAPIMAFVKHDFDGDGNTDLLAAGNYFGVKPYHSRFDSFSGALIKNEKDVISGAEIGLELMQKSVRDLNIITLRNKTYLLVTINNETAQLYSLKMEP